MNLLLPANFIVYGVALHLLMALVAAFFLLKTSQTIFAKSAQFAFLLLVPVVGSIVVLIISYGKRKAI